MYDKYMSKSRLFHIVNMISDLVWLNLLAIICSIPVVTIGAVATALNYTIGKMIAHEGNLLKSFFHSFKENFKQSTIIWLVLLAIGALLTFGIVFYQTMQNTLLMVLLIFVLCVWGVVFSWVFPLCAKFYFSTKDAFRNACLCAIGYGPISLLLLFVNAIPFLLLYFATGVFFEIGYIWLLIWFALATFFTQYMLKKPFQILISQKNLESEN